MSFPYLMVGSCISKIPRICWPGLQGLMILGILLVLKQERHHSDDISVSSCTEISSFWWHLCHWLHGTWSLNDHFPRSQWYKFQQNDISVSVFSFYCICYCPRCYVPTNADCYRFPVSRTTGVGASTKPRDIWSITRTLITKLYRYSPLGCDANARQVVIPGCIIHSLVIPTKHQYSKSL